MLRPLVVTRILDFVVLVIVVDVIVVCGGGGGGEVQRCLEKVGA